MIVKVCGIRSQTNYHQLSGDIDMIGINFYPKSKRYIGVQTLNKKDQAVFVGVFVNEDLEKVWTAAENYSLDYIQCHGHESVEYCEVLKEDYRVIKVFSIDQETDFAQIENYAFCDYFLFDTATKDFGGSGQKFDWESLKNYKGSTRFLLAGGISPKDVQAIKRIKHPAFAGVDINSKFEDSPGIKNAAAVNNFVQKIKA